MIESVEKQKRFITDAGHELKTPLAIISADTEVLEMNGQNNEWTASIRNQIKRLNTLVADLLTLSKLEEGQARQSFREFCLSDAVMEAAESFDPMAEAQEKLLELNISPGINLRGDETAVRKMVSVLVENAIKYTLPNGEVNVTLERRGKYPTLEVVNPTDAMPEGDLNILFERFYRADESRAPWQPAAMAWALSIAKAIAEEHRAKITAHALDQQHIAFTVVFVKS